MPSQQNTFYPIRHKLDGSAESICLNCMASVSVGNQAFRWLLEQKHICRPMNVIARPKYSHAVNGAAPRTRGEQIPCNGPHCQS